MTGARRAAVVLAGLTAAVLGGTLLTAPDLVPSVVGGGRGVLVAAAPMAASGRTAHGSPTSSDGSSEDHGSKDDDHGDHHPRIAHVLTKAVARIERDDHDRRRSAWRLHRVRADLLDAGNVAKARAYRCTGCTAVAVSVQVVVASGVSDVAVGNLADARTKECTSCTATALAYQFVVVSSGRIELTGAARGRLRALRHEMGDVARHAPAAEVTAREDALAAEIAAVLRDGVVLTDDGDDGDDGDRSRASGGRTAAAPSASARVPARPRVTVRRDRDVAHRPAAAQVR